ncbi:hydrogenase maturation protease [Dechloromonas sp. HYN0024]|uniref:hydrogenase maturation protease n=1 Tax=Dechloromonas sp. HYN0024 TaxID=2231055 RepID=UPI000E446DE1|nr:hydrogenase maturation protease [Dechloromonas sp. HYN0024]AXS80513.1 hydrogenase maturation protease [Dechloromonas sp. HYN0024]
MSAPVVIFAVGNPSRGDDAIGPECCARLEAWLDQEGLADQFELIEDFQLQIEHALDLQGRQLALFIDAGANTPGPFTFERIAPASGAACTTHELPPEAVLQVYVQTEGEPPPPAFVLCIRGEGFELGEPLSGAASQHLELAFGLLTGLCQQAALVVWEEKSGPTKG